MASCVCVIIPNLTRNVRPYAFVENVVTHGAYRKKGYATDCLNFARKIAEENHCYKMMLLTGASYISAETLREQKIECDKMQKALINAVTLKDCLHKVFFIY